IEHQKTAPYSPQQNGAAERLNRTLIEMARTMLCHAQHSKGMWAEAVSYSAYLLNRLPTSSTGISPYKKWYGHDPDLTNVKVWGCLGYAHVAPNLRGKLDAKTEPVRFLGFDIGTKAYRVLLLKTNNVVLRRDIVFIEDRFHLPRERRAASSGISPGATIGVEVSNVQWAPAPLPVEEEQEGEEQG
ncbi:MAG: transposase family protein, partial [Gammaproteobacteria bacterium]|nr:transposase family protein [Gammaproteobacteria bacterium]